MTRSSSGAPRSIALLRILAHEQGRGEALPVNKEGGAAVLKTLITHQAHEGGRGEAPPRTETSGRSLPNMATRRSSKRIRDGGLATRNRGDAPQARLTRCQYETPRHVAALRRRINHWQDRGAAPISLRNLGREQRRGEASAVREEGRSHSKRRGSGRSPTKMPHEVRRRGDK